MMKKYVLILLVLSLMVGSAYATIDILSYDDIVLFSKEEDVQQITVNFNCDSNLPVETASARFDNFAYVPATYNGAFYSATLQIFNIPGNYGNKTVVVSCKYYNQSTPEIKEIYVTVDRIDLEILSPTYNDPEEIYQGEYFTNLQISLKSNYISLQNDLLTDTTVKLKSAENIYIISDVLVSYSSPMIVVFPVPYFVKEGIYDIIVEGNYNYKGKTLPLKTSSPRSLNVLSPLSLKILSPSKGSTIKVDSSKTVKVEFQVYEKGNEIVTLSDSNIRFYLGDRELNSRVVYDAEKQRYIANVEIVKPQNYNNSEEKLYLKISNYNTYPTLSFEILRVEYVVSLKGNLKTSSGNPLYAKFIFDNGKRIYVFNTDNKGTYNILIPKGIYNLTIQAGTSQNYYTDEVNVYNLRIDNSIDNFLRINYPSYNLEGFRTIKAFVVEISSPYEKANAKIMYSDSKLIDERNIMALYCDYWNYGMNLCAGDTFKYEYSLNVISNNIYVDDFKGNIILVEKKKIFISLESDDKDYFVNDDVRIIGFVKDFDGKPVEGIKLNYYVKGTEISGEVTSDKNGKFEITFLAPMPKTRIESKELVIYVPSNKIDAKNATFKFNVEKRVKLVAYVDEIVEVEKGKDKEITIEIKNDGDLELTDIQISVAGLKDDWYVFTPAFIETLKPNDNVKVRMRLKLTCDECKDYYFVNMRIKSKEATEDISFTVKVLENRTLLNTTNKVTKEQSRGFFDSVTGKFSAINISNNINYYLIIGFFVAAFIIITIKKRLKKQPAIRRGLFLRKRF